MYYLFIYYYYKLAWRKTLEVIEENLEVRKVPFTISIFNGVFILLFVTSGSFKLVGEPFNNMINH